MHKIANNEQNLPSFSKPRLLVLMVHACGTPVPLNIVYSYFVIQQGLEIWSSDKTTIVCTLGACKVKFEVQKHCREVVLHITDLVHGFDVILAMTGANTMRLKLNSGSWLQPQDSHVSVRRTRTWNCPQRNNVLLECNVMSCMHGLCHA
jgi:hypothetical protein